jgi:lipid-A-disaccharide synthase
MVNLIAQKRLIPELIQNDFTASNIVKELTPLLPDGPSRQSMMKELAELREVLQARTEPEMGDLRRSEGTVGVTAGVSGGGALRTGRAAGGAIARVAEVTLELLGQASPKSA